MSYLGNTPSETFHQATSQVFNGDGSTTAFTLEKRVNRAEEIEVFVNNIQQQPTVAYSANNNTLTFTEAPDSATGNIYVVYRMFAQQNTFNALHDFTDAVTMASTLGVTGVLTANAGVKVDNITIDGTEIDLSSGDLTLDVAGDIILDADGGDVKINDGGSARFHILTSATETQLFNQQQDADIVFKGDDGGSAVTALTLDMSDAGTATFNHDILTGLNANIDIRDADGHISGRLRNVSGSTNSLAIEADPDSGAGNSFINFKVDGSECARIDSSANIFVGRTSLLTDFGAGRTSLVLQGTGSQDYATIQMGNNGTASNTQILGILAFYDGTENNARVQSVRATSTDSADLLFSTRPASGSITERMRIFSDGTTSVGSSSSTGGDQFKIHNNQSSGFCLNVNNANATDRLIISAQSGTGTVFHHQFNNSNGSVGTISTNGSTTSYNTSSDYRLKENITYDFDATTRLKQLKPCRFNFKADKNKTVDGFLAHEVSDIVPEAITGEKDAVDADGNIDPQGIDQAKLVPLMVKTIQELEARLTALEAK